MGYSIKTIGKPADVAAQIAAQQTMPPGVKAALLETINDLKPEYGDFVIVEAYGHFGGGYSNIGKLEVSYLKAAPPAAPPVDNAPAAPPVDNAHVEPGAEQFGSIEKPA